MYANIDVQITAVGAGFIPARQACNVGGVYLPAIALTQASRAGPRPTDVGGDKPLPYMDWAAPPSGGS